MNFPKGSRKNPIFPSDELHLLHIKSEKFNSNESLRILFVPQT